MFKKSLLVSSLLLVSDLSQADVRPYGNVDLGMVDTDADNSLYFDLGAGVQLNKNIEVEIAYNDFGDGGLNGVDFSSYSLGVNLGGYISEKNRLYVILGAERLEADGRFSAGPYSISFDESSTEGYFGIGAAFEQTDNFDIRTKLVSHDSTDIISVSVGLSFYF